MANTRVPVHVSIIMDGNGRWAKQQGKERVFGHMAGTDSVRDCCEYAAEIGIKYLSLFAFSEENWNRPESEVSALMSLMTESILNERPTFKKNNIRFIVVGDRGRLSVELLEKIDGAMDETKDNTGLSLVIFLSYSGKWDIMQAAERYMRDCLKKASRTNPSADCTAAQCQSPSECSAADFNKAQGQSPVECSSADFNKAQCQSSAEGAATTDRTVSAADLHLHLPPLTPDSFASYLSTRDIPDPDLLIRTSGEKRISNFLLWQCAYSEFYFTETLWPDFRRTHLQAAIDDFSSRERRFGKTGEQLKDK